MNSERLRIPAFEDEVRQEELKKLEAKVEKSQETLHQIEFRKRILERTRRTATVKTHMSYKSSSALRCFKAIGLLSGVEVSCESMARRRRSLAAWSSWAQKTASEGMSRPRL